MGKEEILEPRSTAKATLENLTYFDIIKFLDLNMTSLLASDWLVSDVLLKHPATS